MSQRLPLRQAPTIRDLLARASWADLDRIAASFGVQFAGRRRELAVDRLLAVIERPEQLEAAERVLSAPTRATLALLMLLGSVDDERALNGARERLVQLRPELASTLGRIHIGNEIQTLTSLGLCFRDRRRLVVPQETLERLPNGLIPLAADAEALPSARPYAVLMYELQLLLRTIDAEHPAAVTAQRGPFDHVTVFQSLQLPIEAAERLASQLDLPPRRLLLSLALLESLGAAAVQRGHWQAQAAWQPLTDRPPCERAADVIVAWQQPRMVSDVARTARLAWVVPPHVDAGLQIAAHEATLRAVLWRWMSWSRGQPVNLDALTRMLVALHPGLWHFADEREPWIASAGSARASRPGEIHADDVASVLLRELVTQLTDLGFARADERRCQLTPLALPALASPSAEPPLRSVGPRTLLIRPLELDATTFGMVDRAAELQTPDGAYARYELSVAGVSRLLKQGTALDEFAARLRATGAIGPELAAQLADWRGRAGRVRVHRPLAVLLTADDAPLDRILAAAGAGDAAVVVGPGCAVLDPEHVDAAVDQLRARGFWPTTVEHND